MKEGLLDNDVCHQIINVLRMKTGGNILLLDNTGFEYLCELAIDGKSVSYKVLERTENDSEATVKVTLYQSILKSQERFEWSVQKATELGVCGIAPLITERCQISEVRRKDRVFKIMKEASEQSERGKIPELMAEIKFSDIFKRFTENKDSTHLFFYEGMRGSITDLPKVSKNINVVIGPEGGFSDQEAEKIKDFCSNNDNASMLSLGKRVLRSETASIVALSHILTKF